MQAEIFEWCKKNNLDPASVWCVQAADNYIYIYYKKGKWIRFIRRKNNKCVIL